MKWPATCPLLWLVTVVPLYGAEDVILQGFVGSIETEAWTVSGLEATAELTDAGMSAAFRVARIDLIESGQRFEDTRVACARLVLTQRAVDCANATFSASLPGLGRKTFPGSFHYEYDTRVASIRFSSLDVAGGQLEGDITAGDAGVEFRYSGTGMQLDGLLELASGFDDRLAEFSASGTAGLSGTVSLPGEGPQRIVVTAAVADAAIANDSGTVATDGVAGTLTLDVTLDTDGQRVALEFESDRGEAYVEPVYADFNENALQLEAQVAATPDYAEFEVSRFSIMQAGLLDASGTARLRLPANDEDDASITADVELRDASVAYLYDSLVSVQLAGTIFGNLETDGRISGSIQLADSAPRAADLRLDDVILDDRRGRFSVYGLRGRLHWHEDADEVSSPSRLGWDSGTAYSLIVGGAELPLQLGGTGVEFLAPVRVPTMGGALVIRELVLSDFGTDAATGRFDAELEPIQLGQLTAAFGWPAFSGTLSGRLPRLQLADNSITVSGTLSASAFDGTIEMANLRIEQPFGRVPRLRADLALRQLDLQRVTEVFSFGLIQGRLSGEVTGLRMENWRPVAMDMHFFTPPGDRSPHRISQRAVENLASVGGGGAAGVLSTGFLQFFEVFAYDRIGLRCVLENGVCAMSGAGPAGAGPAGSGYYIVKGSGIPRIDVVGYRDTVSWSRLVQQLAAITRGGSPTVN